jgi:D-arabinose 1-dehydrogenase-like Zn-dependent alcohol dehydrogenase
MDPVVTALAAGLALAAIALVACGLVAAWRHLMRDRGPLPLFGMLRQKGVTAFEAGDELGAEALANAARRCAYCGSGDECRQRVAAGTPPPADCPNAALFAGLARPQP